MISIILNVLTVIYIILGLVIIVLATMQTKDTNGASGAITGASTNNFYEQNKGRTKEGKLKKYTAISGVMFGILSIVIGVLYVML